MAETLPLDWGTRLRRERERRKWSRQHVADQIGTGASSVYRWEEEGDQPRPAMLQALITLLGKPVDAWGKSIWTIPYRRNLCFIGRESILKRLHAALSRHEVVAVNQVRAISGLGGIGKTQTAIEYAYRYGDEYDLVLWVLADSRATLVAHLAGLAVHFEVVYHEETDQNRLARAFKQWLETQQERVWLLVFDNVDDLPVVQEFLPTRGNGAVLLTTRLRDVGTTIRKIALAPLTREEGVQFFQAHLGIGKEQERSALSESECQAAEELWALLGGLPLALDQAAAFVEETGYSLVEYRQLFDQARGALLHRRGLQAIDHLNSVAVTFQLAWEQVHHLSPASAVLLRLCAFLAPTAIPEELFTLGARELPSPLCEVLEVPVGWQDVLALLRRYSLLEREGETKLLSVHRLVQAVLREELDQETQRRWAEQVVRLVNAAFPQAGPETWPLCERLLIHAEQAAEWIKQHQIRGEEASRLLCETASYLQYRGRYAEAEPFYQSALHLREQQWGPEHPMVATTLGHLGNLFCSQGKFAEAEALCKRALSIWEQRKEPEHAQFANVLNCLAIICTTRGQYAQAEEFYLQELAMCEQQVDLSFDEMARTLNNLANLYIFQGRYAEAEPLYLRALGIWEKQVGPQNSRVAYPLDGLGTLYHQQGRYREAEQCFRRALSIYEQQWGPTHPQLAYPLASVADLSRDQGKYAEAEVLYLRVLRMWEGQVAETHLDRCGLLTGLAHIYVYQGKYAEAETLYRQALSLFEQQEVPEHYLSASALGGLANLCREQKRFEEAESLYQRALDIREKAWESAHPDTAETLHGLGQLREAQGEREAARSIYERALAVRSQVLGAHHPKTRETRQHLIALLWTMGQREEAVQLEAASPNPEVDTEV